MTCHDCRSIKRLLCIIACKDANAELCKIDNDLKEEAMERKQPWQKELEMQDRKNLAKWTLFALALGLLYLILFVALTAPVSGVSP